MTEQEWLGPGEPDLLLDFVPKALETRRKCRLLACAFCRRVWDYMTVPIARQAVELAEAHADSLTGRADLDAVCETLTQHRQDALSERPELRTNPDPSLLACDAAFYAVWSDPRENHGNMEGTGYVAQEVAEVIYQAKAGVVSEADAIAAKHAEEDTLSELVRDVFGSPFRPIAFDPGWRTDTVVSLARQMYESRDFSVMPILADALQDAGCEHEDVLAHCRGEGPHVRGCWVVDLVLGKS